nr:MAG TPA: hypothetical protein [Caudoviricetes sp.]DAL79721.1 MAG TPA: hypothetical protein [Caudoviricetes sp.]DAL91580.1 MAG TPA: hypothetical protein [Caudoviricetes sp.]DAY88592.1 MAG TPA: hypothetical protein [Caudoviricetes sp.]
MLILKMILNISHLHPTIFLLHTNSQIVSNFIT